MLTIKTQRNIVALLLTCASIFSTTSAVQATEFTIDQFTVTKNGNVIFDDDFSDALSIPNYSNGNAAAYATVPAPLPGLEAGGRLVMDPYAGDIIESRVNGLPIYMNRARLLTNSSNSDANISKGLKDDDTFSVRGLFDLTAPTQLKERYGIRLTDQKNTNPNVGDVVEVDVRKRAGGIFVEFREQDRPNNITNILDSIELTYASFGLPKNIFDTYNQIALSLSRNTTDGDIFGSFALVDSSGVNTDFIYNFSGSSTIFEGERYTRAEFLAVAPASVPEASTLLLFGLGLLSLFGARNRKYL